MGAVAAKTALFALLSDDPETGTPNDTLSDLVERIYRGEPHPGDTAMPSAVTILSKSMSALDITLDLNVYVSTKTDVIATQDQADALIDAIEGLLDADNQFERGQWNQAFFPNLDVWVATCTMTTGRNDF